MYEALEECKCSSSGRVVVKASRGGNRRNRKVCSVVSVELESELLGWGSGSGSGRVRLKSKSIGSINEIELGLLDENVVGKELGLSVKKSRVRVLRKSRSTSVLQGRELVENNNNNNNSSKEEEGVEKKANSRELEVSKLLIDSLGKQLKKLDY